MVSSTKRFGFGNSQGEDNGGKGLELHFCWIAGVSMFFVLVRYRCKVPDLEDGKGGLESSLFKGMCLKE